jgi:hypothetical protein
MPQDQQSINVECQHKRVNYTDPLTCMDCGATLGENDGTLKVVHLKELSTDKQATIAELAQTLPDVEIGDVESTPAAINMRRPLKTRAGIEGKPAKADSKPSEGKKPVKGAITKVEALNAKERIFVVNGVKFYAAVTDAGFRVLSACHESKKTLESAGRVLEIKGWIAKVKRSKEDKSLFTLEAKEKRPSGPWLEDDASAEKKG